MKVRVTESMITSIIIEMKQLYSEKFAHDFVCMVSDNISILNKTYQAFVAVLICINSSAVTDKANVLSFIGDMCGLNSLGIDELVSKCRNFDNALNDYIRKLESELTLYLNYLRGSDADMQSVESTADSFCEAFTKRYYKELGLHDIRKIVLEDEFGFEDDRDDDLVAVYAPGEYDDF